MVFFAVRTRSPFSAALVCRQVPGHTADRRLHLLAKPFVDSASCAPSHTVALLHEACAAALRPFASATLPRRASQGTARKAELPLPAGGAFVSLNRSFAVAGGLQRFGWLPFTDVTMATPHDGNTEEGSRFGALRICAALGCSLYVLGKEHPDMLMSAYNLPSASRSKYAGCGGGNAPGYARGVPSRARQRS